jgi:uncharacterized protein
MTLRRLLIAVAVLAAIIFVSGYLQAIAPATQHSLYYHAQNWPADRPPIRMILISDIHVVEPETPPSRIAALVERINALSPDCVLIAGDLVSDKALATRHIPFDEALAPFAKLTPRIATYVVRGNHDHWRNGSEAYTAIQQHKMVPLVNSAARCGDVTIGGVDDIHTGNDDLPRTKAAMAALGGTPVLLSHSPDIFPSDGQTGLTLTGHTHCGQIKLPFIGALAIPSRYGKRFECGIIRENGRTVVVTSGIGTSIVPLRWFVPPDFWLVTVGP